MQCEHSVRGGVDHLDRYRQPAWACDRCCPTLRQGDRTGDLGFAWSGRSNDLKVFNEDLEKLLQTFDDDHVPAQHLRTMAGALASRLDGGGAGGDHVSPGDESEPISKLISDIRREVSRLVVHDHPRWPGHRVAGHAQRAWRSSPALSRSASLVAQGL